MCGIIGYYGSQNGVELVYKGLKRLEYRGYDSWGVAVASKQGFRLEKETGRLTALPNIAQEGKIALGHTRWATHGGVTQENAHPHLSQDGRIAVVHNGIIENHAQIRKELEENGATFRSDTDTEVLPHLISHYLVSGLEFKEAVQKTTRRIEGYYAFLAADATTQTVAAARHGSPLVLGVSEQGLFAASDVPAFIEKTRNVVFLQDGEMALLNSEGIKLFKLETGNPVEHKVETVDWSIEQAEKGDYPDFMLKEIMEQSGSITKAVEQDPALLQQAVGMLKDAKGTFFVGCGTSYHACVTSAYLFVHVAQMHVNTVIASELQHYAPFIKPETLVVAVSQSGETIDVLEAVRVARKKGAKIIAICNVVGSTLAREADLVLAMNAGPEICVLSTKTYTAQLAVLARLAYGVAGKDQEGRTMLLEAAKKVAAVLEKNRILAKRLAKRLKNTKDIFLIGRDLAYPSALEGALKIKEVSYIHAEGFAGAELKHGTIALIEKSTPAIAVATKDTRALILSNATEIKSRGGFIIGVDEEDSEVYDAWLWAPDGSMASPLLLILPIQLLAYELARARGCDVDKPRNLAKSVTVK